MTWCALILPKRNCAPLRSDAPSLKLIWSVPITTGPARTTVLTLIAASLVLHLGEEYFAFPIYIRSLGRQLSAWLPAPALQHSMTNLRIALIVGAVLPSIVIVWGMFSRAHGLLIASLLVEAVLLVNGFAHVLSALLRAGYVPGLITGVLINIPLGIYIFRRVVREGWIRRYRAWQLIIIAALVHVVWLGSSFLTAKQPMPQ